MPPFARLTWFRVVVALMLALPGIASPDIRLPSVIADGMVIQRGIRAPIWGTAAPGELVTVQLGARKIATTADSAGAFIVRVGPLSPGAPLELRVSSNSGSASVKDILVGDVWVASGQSNMEWPVAASRDAEIEMSRAKYPEIRLFNVQKAVAATPQKTCAARWEACDPKSVAGFSAVAYFFGRSLYQRYRIPIGLIGTSWGGTPSESWTPSTSLTKDADTAVTLKRLPSTDDPDPKKREWNSWTPTGLYNAMIAPLVPFAIKGAIWYQGESNADRAYQYRKLFPAMVQGWRDAWGQGDFPFFWVQLANFTQKLKEPSDSTWAELREAQSMALSLPNTGMAVTIDIGEANDIHPRNKQDVGQRLALAAQCVAYGDPAIVGSGPVYKSMKAANGEISLAFTHISGGLTTPDGGVLRGFAVAGRDRKFVWADARVIGDRVVVSSPMVEHPVAVRYAWANNPDANLCNGAGLPASPFRTDAWPGATVEAKW